MSADAFDDMLDLSHCWIPECPKSRPGSASASGKSPRHVSRKLKTYYTQNDTDHIGKLTYVEDVQDSRDGCGQQIYYVTASPIEQTCVIFSHDERHCWAYSEDGQSLHLTTLQDKIVNEPEEKTGNEHPSDEQTGDERAVVKFAESKQCIGGEQTGNEMIVTEDKSNPDVSSKNVFKCRRYLVCKWSRISKGMSNPEQLWVCAFKTARLAVNRCIGAVQKDENSAWTVALLPTMGLVERKHVFLPVDKDTRYFAQQNVEGREGFLAFRSTLLAGEGELFLAVKNEDLVYFEQISDFDRTVDSCDALFKIKPV